MVIKGSKTAIVSKFLLKEDPTFLTGKVHDFWRNCWTVGT